MGNGIAMTQLQTSGGQFVMVSELQLRMKVSKILSCVFLLLKSRQDCYMQFYTTSENVAENLSEFGRRKGHISKLGKIFSARFSETVTN